MQWAERCRWWDWCVLFGRECAELIRTANVSFVRRARHQQSGVIVCYSEGFVFLTCIVPSTGVNPRRASSLIMCKRNPVHAVTQRSLALLHPYITIPNRVDDTCMYVVCTYRSCHDCKGVAPSRRTERELVHSKLLWWFLICQAVLLSKVSHE